MELSLESGRVIADVAEADIRAAIEGEDFAILSDGPDTYMQCAEHQSTAGHYILEFQDGSVDQHYAAAGGPFSLDRVVAAFVMYLRRDPSWRTDFDWERVQF